MVDGEDPRDALIPQAGVRIGRYALLPTEPPNTGNKADRLGVGGSGVVLRVAQDLAEGVRVLRALKVFLRREDIAALPQHSESGPVSSSDFFEEVQALSAFNHENVLKIVDSGIWEPPGTALKVPYIVSDLVGGPNLKSLQESGLQTSFPELLSEYVIDVLLQICAGLDFLHRNDYYHCDVKPANIFLRKLGAAEVQLIVGDLGVGKFIPTDDAQVRIVGSRAYMPPCVEVLLDSIVTGSVFKQLQPSWDVYSAAKTCHEVLRSVSDERHRDKPWYKSLDSVLMSAQEESAFSTMAALKTAIHWCHPRHYRVGDVQELSDVFQGSRPTLLAVEAAVTSLEVRTLANHPSMTRLKRVPQIFMGPAVFHGAVHTRYEHCLGAYQVARRYLRALLNDPVFLSTYKPEWGETFLISALLYGLRYFGLSPVFVELRSSEKDAFPSLSAENLIEELFARTGVDGVRDSLSDAILKSFPRVQVSDVRALVSGNRFGTGGPQQRCSAFLLGSSVDVRVLDYLRRDALHLGIAQENLFDLNDVLQYMRFDGGHIAFEQAGIQALEQVISLRQWLFSRVYWNRPNRMLIAMASEAILGLRERLQSRSLEEGLRERALGARDHEILEYLEARANEVGDPALKDLTGILKKDRPAEYRELCDFGRAADPFPTESLRICDGIEASSIEHVRRLRVELDDIVRRLARVGGETINVLIDYPREVGRSKLGEDLKVYRRDGRPESLRAMSGIVAGTQDAFQLHLRRVRIFVHPKVNEALESGRRRVACAKAVRERLVAEFM